MKHSITTQRELREVFWLYFPGLECRRNSRGNPKRQNDQPTDTRVAWVDYVDAAERSGVISRELAQRATL